MSFTATRVVAATLLGAFVALAFASCDRIVNLSPPSPDAHDYPDAFPQPDVPRVYPDAYPDAFIPNDAGGFFADAFIPLG